MFLCVSSGQERSCVRRFPTDARGDPPLRISSVYLLIWKGLYSIPTGPITVCIPNIISKIDIILGIFYIIAQKNTMCKRKGGGINAEICSSQTGEGSHFHEDFD